MQSDLKGWPAGLWIRWVISAAMVGWCWTMALGGETDNKPAVEPEVNLRIGAADVELQAEDNMPIAGSIHAGYVKGQEGKLRAVAVVLQKADQPPVALVSCDLLILPHDLLAPVEEEIQRRCNIPASHLLIHATHTHHAPSTCRVHAYGPDERFCRQVQKAIVEAVAAAQARLAPAGFFYGKGEEKTIGQNSRLLLQDGTIYWIGPRSDVVRPTGPVDPDVPVLVFRSPEGNSRAGCGRLPFTVWPPKASRSNTAVWSGFWKGPAAPPIGWMFPRPRRIGGSARWWNRRCSRPNRRRWIN